jgi:nitroreductase
VHVIRKYAGKQIPEVVLEKIIKAGIYAPSALAHQPWGFVIFEDCEFLATESRSTVSQSCYRS